MSTTQSQKVGPYAVTPGWNEHAFTRSLVERAENLRLPTLFARPRPDAVYQVLDRGGVSAVMIETGALTEEELTALLRFRLAQYLAAGFADGRAISESRLEHEPLSSVAQSDYHVLAGTPDGEILCYLAVRGSQPAWPGQRMRSHVRRPFPVEEMHGMGIYDRLAVLPDLCVAKVRDIGRFVKSQHRHGRDELGVRAPVEVLLALIRGILGPLRPLVDALVGEVEEGVVKRNLDFFDVPTVLIRGTVSYEAPSWFIGHHGRTFYPFALSVPDVGARSLPRVDAIEPGARAIRPKGRSRAPCDEANRRASTEPARAAARPAAARHGRGSPRRRPDAGASADAQPR